MVDSPKCDHLLIQIQESEVVKWAERHIIHLFKFGHRNRVVNKASLYEL